MTRKIRYLITGVGSISLLVATFFGGLHVGKEYATTQTSMTLIGSDTLDQRTVLKMLNKNDVEPAKKFLNSAIDANILQLQALIMASDNTELKNRSQHVLAIIANDRENRTTTKNHIIPEVDQRVKSILDATKETPSGH